MASEGGFWDADATITLSSRPSSIASHRFPASPPPASHAALVPLPVSRPSSQRSKTSKESLDSGMKSMPEDLQSHLGLGLYGERQEGADRLQSRDPSLLDLQDRISGTPAPMQSRKSSGRSSAPPSSARHESASSSSHGELLPDATTSGSETDGPQTPFPDTVSEGTASIAGSSEPSSAASLTEAEAELRRRQSVLSRVSRKEEDRAHAIPETVVIDGSEINIADMDILVQVEMMRQADVQKRSNSTKGRDAEGRTDIREGFRELSDILLSRSP